LQASIGQLAIEKQASSADYRRMTIDWIAKLARPLGRVFKPAERIPAEFVDRDAERMRIELDLIRTRFPHHS
jgi:hypothetical protein